MRVSRARKVWPRAAPRAVPYEKKWSHEEVSIPADTGEQSAAALPPRPGGSAGDVRRLATQRAARWTGLAFGSTLIGRLQLVARVRRPAGGVIDISPSASPSSSAEPAS